MQAKASRPNQVPYVKQTPQDLRNKQNSGELHQADVHQETKTGSPLPGSIGPLNPPAELQAVSQGGSERQAQLPETL